MTQTTNIFLSTAFRLELNEILESIVTTHKGNTAPSYAIAGILWLDDSQSPFLLKIYDGTDWIILGAVDEVNNVFIPYVNGQAIEDYLEDQTVKGSVMAYAGSVAPSGWLECDGSAVSRTTYANLFTVVGETYGAGDGSTTFNLPDLRGEFIRGWDNGRGIDGGRTLGSTQQDEFKSHTHSINATDGGTASTYTTVTEGRLSPSGSVSTNASGGNETRPRNVAMMYIIKH